MPIPANSSDGPITRHRSPIASRTRHKSAPGGIKKVNHTSSRIWRPNSTKSVNTSDKRTGNPRRPAQKTVPNSRNSSEISRNQPEISRNRPEDTRNQPENIIVQPENPIILQNNTIQPDFEETMDALAPRKFDGVNKADADRWIVSIKSYAALRKSEFHALLPFFLEDGSSAQTWYEKLTVDVKADSTKLYDAFVAKYGNTKNDIMDLKHQLTNLQQGTMSVNDYFNKFSRIAHQISMDETEAIAMAKRQLAAPYSTQLFLQDYKTLDELYEAAQQLEKLTRPPPVVATAQASATSMDGLVNSITALTNTFRDTLGQTVTTAVHTAVNGLNQVNAVSFKTPYSDRQYEDRGRSRSNGGDRKRSGTPHRSTSSSYSAERKNDSRRDSNRGNQHANNSRRRSDYSTQHPSDLLQKVIERSRNYGEFKRNCGKTAVCYNCGKYRSPFMEHICPAINKSCDRCHKENHFAMCCSQQFKKQ